MRRKNIFLYSFRGLLYFCEHICEQNFFSLPQLFSAQALYSWNLFPQVKHFLNNTRLQYNWFFLPGIKSKPQLKHFRFSSFNMVLLFYFFLNNCNLLLIISSFSSTITNLFCLLITSCFILSSITYSFFFLL